jgi:hypothetical protein
MGNLDLEIPNFKTDFDIELNLDGLISAKAKETGLLPKAAKGRKVLDAQVVKKHYQELGKKAAKARWENHTKRTKEEIREYNKLKMREYRARIKKT